MLNSDYTQDSNSPGVMRLIIVSDDAFLNDVIDGDFSTIEIAQDAILTEVLFAPNSCNFIYSTKPSEFGTLYQCQISCNKPKLAKQINQFFADNAERKWVAFVQDFNFQVHVVGVPEGGLILVNTASTGGSINNNALNFVGDMIFPPFILDNFDMNFFAGVDLTDYATQDFRVMRGNSLYESIQFTNPDGSLQQLEDDQFVMDVVNNQGDIVLSFSRVIVEGLFVETGFTVSVDGFSIFMQKTAAQMLVVPGVYRYDLIRVSDAVTKTVMRGNFVVEGNISSL